MKSLLPYTLLCSFLAIGSIILASPIPKMKILFIMDKFPYYTKTVILNQVVSLLECGHDVYVYAHRGEKSEKLDPEVFAYRLLERTYYNRMPPDLDTYDVIICQYGDLGKDFIKMKRLCNLKAKFVTCFRGGDITNDSVIYDNAFKDLLKDGDLFLPICEYFKYKLISLGCDPKKIKIQYSPINCQRFSKSLIKKKKSKKVRIVSVHRLFEQKGTEYVIRALSKVIKKYPNIEYVVAGDGPEKKKLKKLIQKLGLENYVSLRGWRSQEEVAQLLKSADLFILFSITINRGVQEAIPNAIKEAMLMEIPVISTYHGGIAELVRNKYNGFLVPERDINALAKTLRYLLSRKDLWPLLGKNGRKSVLEKFDMWHLGETLEQALYSCCLV